MKSGRLNIRANTFPVKIDRVAFELNGPITHTQVEKDFPYALFGDHPTGDFKGREWLPGLYTLTVTPYTKDEKGIYYLKIISPEAVQVFRVVKE